MKTGLKVVFDTNIFVSAIVFGGNPRTCLELAREGKILLFSSRAILLELSRVLKIKLAWQNEDIKDIIRGIDFFAKIISPKIEVDKIKKDKRDNRILECALEAKADYIISGDKHHLLPLKKFRKIPILSPADFLRRI